MSRSLFMGGLVLMLGLSTELLAGGNMIQVEMKTAIGEGADQEVVKLHENEWTKLVQITLRNGKTLERHVAKEPVTIQCVAGEGTLVTEGVRTPLKAGVIVPLEANVPHAVETDGAVSVLVTRFLSGTGSPRSHEHKH